MKLIAKNACNYVWYCDFTSIPVIVHEGVLTTTRDGVVYFRKLCIVGEYFCLLATYIPPVEVADCSFEQVLQYAKAGDHVNRGWRPPYRAEITRSVTNLRCNTIYNTILLADEINITSTIFVWFA